jgi:hypothetical protein
MTKRREKLMQAGFDDREIVIEMSRATKLAGSRDE